MQSNKRLNIGIEGNCLFGHADGISAYTYNLIKYLCVVEKKDRFLVLSSAVPLFKKNRIDFKQHNLVNPGIFSSAARQRIDVYHDACFALTTPEPDRSHIVTVHDISSIARPELYPEDRSVFFRDRLAKVLKNTGTVIVPSDFVKREVLKFFTLDAGKINVIYEGIGDEFVPQTVYRTGLVKARYGLKRPYILFVGPVEERKNISGVLEAYSQLKYESPPDLVIAGDKRWLKEDLNDKIKRLELSGTVKYLGYVPKKELPALYSGAQLLVWPSLYEGFGLPVLEAMSCGTPVITSDASSMPEVAGDAAVLVNPYNIDGIADAIRGLLSNKERRLALSQKGLARAKLFSAKKMASDTLELYRKAAMR
ncbi:MAG: glycosyltransferase family 1 protein [Candidatus Saganbacteria bacterium]|nr:glycosyltransferase family 1 protein [Candidatus Saganbacteria bacterium]